MNEERLLQVLLGPHVSEKATIIADQSKQITFRVLRDATKEEIKKAVEHLFDVKVAKVCSINVKGKEKRFKGSIGQRKDWKKAYVALEPGHDITFAEGA